MIEVREPISLNRALNTVGIQLLRKVAEMPKSDDPGALAQREINRAGLARVIRENNLEQVK